MLLRTPSGVRLSFLLYFFGGGPSVLLAIDFACFGGGLGVLLAIDLSCFGGGPGVLLVHRVCLISVQKFLGAHSERGP